MSQMLQAPYVRGQDQATPTTIGTGTTRTRLNADAPVTTPNEARNLIGVIGGCAPNAALTAAQSMLCRFDATSNAIKDILPKSWVSSPVHGGLGTFAAGMVPGLIVMPWNTPLSGNEDVSYFGTALVANTAAPDAWVDVLYGNRRPNPRSEPHVFWDGPTNETSTGTAAADGIVGEAFTLNAPKMSILRYLYTILGVGTVTASESWIATGEISSNDYLTSMPVKGSAQPIAAGLGTAVEVLQPNQLLHEMWIPAKATARMQTLLNLQEAQTAAGNWWLGSGFLRVN